MKEFIVENRWVYEKENFDTAVEVVDFIKSKGDYEIEVSDVAGIECYGYLFSDPVYFDDWFVVRKNIRLKKEALKMTTYLISEDIKKTDFDDMYDYLDIFNAYRSGLCGSSLERNFEFFDDNDEKGETYKKVLELFDESEIDELNENIWEDVYSLLWEQHIDYRDSLYDEYLRTGKSRYTWVEEYIKNSLCLFEGLSFDNVSFREYDTVYSKIKNWPKSLSEFWDMADEYMTTTKKDYDSYEMLYSCGEFNPTKRLIIDAILEVLENGYNSDDLVSFNREMLIDFYLD